MRHKLPIFLFAAAIICFIVGFFKSNQIASYDPFTIMLFVIGLAAAFVIVVIGASWMGELISSQRRFHGVAYQPMPEECDGHCAPGECVCEGKDPKYCDGNCDPKDCAWCANKQLTAELKRELGIPELFDETEVMHPNPYEPKAAAYTEEMVPFVAEDVHAGEESHHDDDELPKDDFMGVVEVAPVEATPAPTPPPVAPHEDQNHPNYDHAAGRIIYK